MISSLSEEDSFRILLLITKELILNSKTEETIQLEKNLQSIRELERLRKPLVNKPVFQKRVFIPQNNSFNRTPPQNVLSYPRRALVNDSSSQPVFNAPPVFNVPSNMNFGVRRERSRLVIPDVNLPEKFQYLKPIPTKEELNLGKLNSLIRNPQVKEIECDGPDTEVIVKDPMPKKTDIFLTTEEIKDIFAAFSRVAKIPVEENVIKIAAGNLILNGINSDVIGSKFIIRKIQSAKFY